MNKMLDYIETQKEILHRELAVINAQLKNLENLAAELREVDAKLGAHLQALIPKTRPTSKTP